MNDRLGKSAHKSSDFVVYRVKIPQYDLHKKKSKRFVPVTNCDIFVEVHTTACEESHDVMKDNTFYCVSCMCSDIYIVCVACFAKTRTQRRGESSVLLFATSRLRDMKIAAVTMPTHTNTLILMRIIQFLENGRSTSSSHIALNESVLIPIRDTCETNASNRCFSDGKRFDFQIFHLLKQL